ncbi:HdeD family acid-resistance protein [Apibacter muscae]|uniref:HdeD family acid-resistance protein n=1 Tax=Apibacter muscae TaxID=2509004 RepID=A0A563DHZ1_9FLAO|nr:DUF308 domain-containing protein [Apibacter muscae]TWP24824.1 HdeD family acid-resistance protein [Apibacter muscae]TWP29878.1 HdeD family acid-resistance protein [Apibacter muscae]TWP31026.1 HdeD family acid-resistance protein [Apibacter muscae]
MNTFVEPRKSITNHWWVLLLLGIIFLLGGIIVLSKPAPTLIFISTFFAISFLLTGIFEIFFSLSNTKNSSWGWYLAGGIFDLLIGIVLLRSSIITRLDILAFFIGFWILFKGVSLTGYSLDIKKLGSNNWGWLLFFGILEIIFSLIILVVPSIGLATLLVWISVSIIFIGIYYIFLSLTLKSI